MPEKEPDIYISTEYVMVLGSDMRPHPMARKDLHEWVQNLPERKKPRRKYRKKW